MSEESESNVRAPRITRQRINFGMVAGGRTLGAGGIQVAPADQFLDGTGLDGTGVDSIKSDVEGGKLSGLDGLTKTPAHRPAIFIEAKPANRPGLDAWMETVGYIATQEGRQFRHNGNLLLTARDA